MPSPRFPTTLAQSRLARANGAAAPSTSMEQGIGSSTRRASRPPTIELAKVRRTIPAAVR